jgi:hypothetical protein
MQCKHLGNMAAATSRFVIAFALANVIGSSSVRADDPKAMFKEMSDYLASQNAMSFNYDSNLEVVTTENQKLGLALRERRRSCQRHGSNARHVSSALKSPAPVIVRLIRTSPMAAA